MFKPKNKINTLVESSNNVISVFTNTVNSLSEINEEINSEVDSKVETIKVLQDEITSLDNLRSSNNRIIEKVKQILS